MAEAVLRHKLREMGLERDVTVDSAGTGGWHAGDPPHVGTRTLLDAKGISWDGIVARQIRLLDLTQFDYILTMDEDNLRAVRHLGKPIGTLAPLLSFHPNAPTLEVPDPYYSNRFEEVYTLVNSATDGFIAHLRQQRQQRGAH
jgi:protein-tyrosine phosphatase